MGNTLCFVFLFFLSLYAGICGYNEILGKLGALLCVCSGALLIIKAYKAKNTLFITIFVFMFLYTWPLKLLFYDGLYLSGHHLEYSFNTAFWTTIILAFFLLLLNRYVRIPFYCSTFNNLAHRNSLIFYFIFFVSLAIVIFFRPVGNVYMGDEDTSSSSLYEYNLILFFILYLYADSKRKRILFIMLGILFTYFTVTSGGRVAIIMFSLLLMVVHYQKRINYKFYFISLIFVIWALNIFEKVRSNPTVLLEENIFELVNPFNENKSGYQHSNFGDVVWASERLLILSEEGKLPLSERLYSFLYFCLSPFFSTSSLPELANLTTYKRDFLSSGGGSLAPVIFYMYGGVLGVFLFARFVAKCLNRLFIVKDNFASYYSILMVVTLPRWFAYHPIQLIKFCIIGAIVIWLTMRYDKMYKRHRLKTN